MLPSGEIVSDCEVAADQWVVNDPSKPHCPHTSFTTRRPATTPSGGGAHKNCSSPLCELIKDRCGRRQPQGLQGRLLRAPLPPLSKERRQGAGGRGGDRCRSQKGPDSGSCFLWGRAAWSDVPLPLLTPRATPGQPS